MNNLKFILNFYLIIVPIKLLDLYVTYSYRFNEFFGDPLFILFNNLDDIIQFATLGSDNHIIIIILMIISSYRFKKIGMSGWYSLGLVVPIWNIYLLYKLLDTEDSIEEKNNKIGKDKIEIILIIVGIIVIFFTTTIFFYFEEKRSLEQHRKRINASQNETIRFDWNTIVNKDLTTGCYFNGKKYIVPINAYCTTSNKYNAWLCNSGYYESWGHGQDVCINKNTNMYEYR